MAKVYISEYETLTRDSRGVMLPAGQEPAIATQVVNITAGSLASAAFNARTRFIRVHTDAICSYDVGANPTASASKPRMAANQTEFFGVAVGQGHKIAIISNT